MVDVNRCWEDGTSPLFIAAQEGHVQVKFSAHGRNILNVCHPIGHMSGIFSVPVLLLATRQE
jgi:hypothetical protein